VSASDQIADIARVSDNTTIEAGPLNVRLVKDAAGRNHHQELHLERGVNAGLG
jgi:hypothetical protein